MTDLDDLFTQAQLAQAQLAQAAINPKRKRAPEDIVSSRAMYENPANWERRRGVALLHVDSQTILGQFSEYVHKIIPSTRKLVRETWPISVEAVERVEGSWWIAETERPQERQPWHTKKRVFVHLHLDSLGVRAPAVEVEVHFQWEGIARVELVEETKFAGEGTLLILPEGTNVLEVLSLDSKLNMRREVGL